MKKNIVWIAGLVAFVLLIIGASLLYNKLGTSFDRDGLLNDNSANVDDNKDNDLSDSNNDNPTNNENNSTENGESGGENQENGSNEEQFEDIPFPSADFTVLDYNGNDVKLSDMKGKPIIINFWASWCPNCVGEMPTFNSVYSEYKDKVVFMMINCGETQKEVENYISKNGYSFPVYMDTHYDASITYNASQIPLTCFFDADGNLVKGYLGALDTEFLTARIEELLK